jgi:hypothetical protein
VVGVGEIAAAPAAPAAAAAAAGPLDIEIVNQT